MTDKERVVQLQGKVDRLRREIAKVIVGQESVIEETLVAILCGGHVLLEGAPGLGKTQLVKAFAKGLELSFSRIQFTPDLMPADIIGTNVLLSEAEGRDRRIAFQKGPIFAHLVLADEINRATPKTQSALLEAMQERSVTVGGVTYRLEEPFFVMATQNPIEMEGTYPLPEAQIDRFFFKLRVLPPSRGELLAIVQRTTGEATISAEQVLTREELLALQALVREVPIASHVLDFAIDIVHATHPESLAARRRDLAGYVRYGASPRGAQALVLAAKARAFLSGRFNASIEDVTRMALPALRHRIILSFEAETEGVDPEHIVTSIIETAAKEVAS